MAMRSNAVAWNPREPMYFTAANEDHNLYTFDMRTLKKAVNVHKDFLGPVMDVAYSPTGREFVAGSYDRTVRIFRTRDGRSREVYHARRMQRVFTVSYVGRCIFFLFSGTTAAVTKPAQGVRFIVMLTWCATNEQMTPFVGSALTLNMY